MKGKLVQFLKDSEDLEYMHKCPNDFKFWYFILLNLYIMFPVYIAFVFGYLCK